MRKRVFTLVIGVLLFLIVFGLDSLKLVQGPLFFNISITIVSSLMCHELYKALEVKGFKPIKIIGYLSTLFIIPIGIVDTKLYLMGCSILLPLMIFACMSVTVFSKLKYNIADVSLTITGAIYTVFMMAFLSFTRAMPLGVFLVFYTIWGAWFSDIFAFLIGIKIGKHKISTISPKKSVEGCIAGVLGTILFFVIYSMILSTVFMRNVPDDAQTLLPVEPMFATGEESSMDVNLQKYFYSSYPLLIILGILVSFVSQIGDLVESGIKRHCDIKDFSNLMPGHGGMLDRFDSVLFVAPLMYFVFFVIQLL